MVLPSAWCAHAACRRRRERTRLGAARRCPFGVDGDGDAAAASNCPRRCLRSSTLVLSRVASDGTIVDAAVVRGRSLDATARLLAPPAGRWILAVAAWLGRHRQHRLGSACSRHRAAYRSTPSSSWQSAAPAAVGDLARASQLDPSRPSSADHTIADTTPSTQLRWWARIAAGAHARTLIEGARLASEGATAPPPATVARARVRRPRRAS